jgi:hypothetical protein
MSEETNHDACPRRDDLLSVVYGEATTEEARSFQQHLTSCTTCHADYSTFNGIHNSLFAWREETVGRAAQSIRSVVETPKPSALAAIREFFNLSPLWLKGAVAFASVAFCALAVLVVMRSNEGPVEPALAQKNEAEIEKLVEARTQERLAAIKANEQANQTVAVNQTRNAPSLKPTKKRSLPNSSQVATNRKTRPLSKAEREQLAADLRLTSTEEESELDILGESNNRQQD